MGALLLLLVMFFSGSETAVEKLRSEWGREARVAYKSGTAGDIEPARKYREISAKSQKKVWDYVRRNPKAKDIEEAWELLLRIDEKIGDVEAEAEHAREYLKQFPQGIYRSYAEYRLGLLTIVDAKSDEEVDALITEFDRRWPTAILERGTLRAKAAERAAEAGNIQRALKLYDEALAFPKTDEERELEARNHGIGWHNWWQRDRDRLDLFRETPELVAKDVDGKPVDLRKLQGKEVLIAFWSPPCCKDRILVDLRSLYDELHLQGLEIIGVGVDQAAGNVKGVKNGLRLRFPNIHCEGGMKNPLAKDFKVNGIPHTVLIDSAGKVRAVGLRGIALEDKVRSLLAEKTQLAAKR